ncbi:MAG: hypothetical protein DI561_14980 [Thauera sp.]|nr:MAG: hypothetical protein DI561_14980 [Thauera sp.]
MSAEMMWIGGPVPAARNVMCFPSALQPEFWDELEYEPVMDAPEQMPAGSCIKAVANLTAWASQRRAVR